MIAGSLMKLALQALWANRLRSGLTLLGVIVGFTSVMTIISALEGMMGKVQDALERMGPATFVVSPMDAIITSHEQFLEMMKRKPLETRDLDYIREACDECEIVVPRYFNWGRESTAKYRDQAIRDIVVFGCAAEYISIVDLDVAQGRFFSHEDDLYHRQVAFIGEDLRTTLYSGVDCLGKSIRIDGSKYTVIGVAKKQGSFFGQSQDGFVVIPASAYWKQYGDPGRFADIMIKARSVDKVQTAIDQVRTVLRSRRHVPFNKPDDFSFSTADSLMKQFNQFTKIFRMALVGISSIALVVGGIVVMNIMMVSVTERTREIGIRKSVGAKQKHILVQFLFEALVTTLTGGVIGIVIGFLTAKFLVGMIEMDISPSTLAICSGLAISVGIGLIFGIYPAMKAARLDPIKALSYE